MERLTCERCGARQPVDFRPGDVCTACGGPARSERRCAWCTRLSPGEFCRGCGTKLIAPEHFGAARMLVRAGVDRLSLPARLATLDAGQRDTFTAIYAAEWAAALRRLDEARLCESFLLGRGFAAAFEDALVAQLPDEALAARLAGPATIARGAEDLTALLDEGVLEEVRVLAALASLRLGRLDRRAIGIAEQLLRGEGPLAREAAFALSRFRVRAAARSDGWLLRRIRELARLALDDPRTAPSAAVAMLADVDPTEIDPVLAAALREGLTGSDADLRLDCAALLGEEDALAPFAESRDAQAAAFARRALGRRPGRRALAILRAGPDEARLEVLRGMAPPFGSGTLAALLAMAGEAGDETRSRALGLVRRAPFATLARSDQEAVERFVVGATRLSAGEVIDLLRWAAPPIERDGDAAAGELGAFVRAVALAVDPLDDDARAVKLGEAGDPFFARIGGADGARLAAWARGPRSARAILSGLFRVHSFAAPGSGTAVATLEALWEATDQASLASVLGEETEDHRGLRGREEVLAMVWRRFKRHPAERAALLSAFSVWKPELLELRDADTERPARDDAVEHFRIFCGADPLAIVAYADEALARARPEELTALTHAVFDAATPLCDGWPRSAVVAVFHVAAALANRIRAEPPDSRLDEAMERVRARLPAFRARWDEGNSESDSQAGASHFFEDIATELRLVAEAHAHRPRPVVESKTAAEPQSESPPRVGPPRPDPPRAEPPRAAPSLPRPNIAPAPVDTETLVSGPLATLVDYVGFLKAMSAVQIPELFAAVGLDATSWAVIVQAWSGHLKSRPEIALRFAALMQASWS